MPQEFSESEPIVLGEARLGALCSRSARWIRQKENEGIVSRLEPNGTSPSRALYLLDEAMPRLIAHLTSKRQPTPETQALAAQRVEAGRLKLEAARLELGKLEGKPSRPKLLAASLVTSWFAFGNGSCICQGRSRPSSGLSWGRRSRCKRECAMR